MQNLRNGSPPRKAHKSPQFACQWCTKKYKSKEKYEQHVTTHHPYAALYKNTQVLTLEERLWLLDELERYASFEQFDLTTARLGVSHETHAEFRRRITHDGLLDRILSDARQILRLLDEFQAFLNLGMPWHGKSNFCPSLLIDLIWHSAMQNQERYIDLCVRFMGVFKLTHCVSTEQDPDQVRFQEFVRQFQHQHRRPYLAINDMIQGRFVNGGIEAARRILRNEQEKERQEQERQRAENQKAVERWRAKVEQEKRDGTYVPYYDDGKC